MFRWDRLGEDRWIGVDGDAWFDVRVGEESLRVATNSERARFERLFRLDEPVEQYVDEIVAKGPELAPYVASLPGLRLMRPFDPVEETFCFLCTANNNLSRILKMVRVLSAKGRDMAMKDRENLYIFPSMETIASLEEGQLRNQGFGYRAATIPSIARQMLDRGGEAWLKSLKRVPYEQAHSALVEIKGIGPKLADCICLFALHHTEAVPVDTHLWQAAVRHYFPHWKGKALTEQRYKAVGDLFRDRFGTLAGWAHQYLFYDNLLNWRTYQKG